MSSDPIKTLVFFDLESTGLPAEEFLKTKITELCLVACSVDHIRSTKRTQIPRVLHKLSVCLNPYRMISPISTQITGLDNFALEHENPLSENTVKLLVHFLLQLQQPVCLVAHNGSDFDFPLLHKELARLSVVLPSTVHCLDSLEVFRKIDEQRNVVTPDVLAVPLDSSVECIERQLHTKVVPGTGDQNSLDELLKEAARLEASEATDIRSEDEDSLDKLLNGSTDWQLLNETTPHRIQIQTHMNQYMDRTTPTGASKHCAPKLAPITSKRKLFADAPTPHQKNAKRFKLVAVHERLFGQLPDVSHYAEADAMALLKCVVAAQDAFLPLVDIDALPFDKAKRSFDRRT